MKSKEVNQKKISKWSKFKNFWKELAKDLKRARWPKIKEVRKSYLITILFIVIAALILFGIAVGFAALWNSLGVGVNG